MVGTWITTNCFVVHPIRPSSYPCESIRLFKAFHHACAHGCHEAIKVRPPAKGIFGRNQGNQGNQVMLVVDYCRVLGKLAALSKFNQNCRIDCKMLIFFDMGMFLDWCFATIATSYSVLPANWLESSHVAMNSSLQMLIRFCWEPQEPWLLCS